MSDAPFEELYPEIMRRTRKTREALADQAYRRDDLRHSRIWREFIRGMAASFPPPESLSSALPGDNIRETEPIVKNNG